MFFVFALLFSAAPARAEGDLISRLQGGEPLRCAYLTWSKSYFSKDPNTGEFMGIGYELAEALADVMEIDIKWTEEITLGTMYEGLRTGRYDAICTPIVQEPAGGAHALFTRPAYFAPIYAFARKDDDRFDADAPDPLALINRPDVIVADVDGSNLAQIHKIHYPQATLHMLPNLAGAPELITEVLTGKADITHQSPTIIDDFFDGRESGLKRVSGPLITYPLSIVVLPRGARDAKDWFDLGVQTMLNTGMMDAILQKYNPNGMLPRVRKDYEVKR